MSAREKRNKIFLAVSRRFERQPGFMSSTLSKYGRHERDIEFMTDRGSLGSRHKLTLTLYDHSFWVGAQLTITRLGSPDRFRLWLLKEGITADQTKVNAGHPRDRAAAQGVVAVHVGIGVETIAAKLNARLDECFRVLMYREDDELPGALPACTGCPYQLCCLEHGLPAVFP